VNLQPRLHVEGLNKTFGPTQVLHDIEITLNPGELHALIGQNGSGKSTVVKVLTGYHASDPGARLEIDGVAIRTPVVWKEAHARGVSVVHQDFGLLDQLTVAENVGVGGFETTSWLYRITWARQEQIAAEVLARLGSDLDPCRPVGTLSAAERSEVAIARALRDHQPGSGLIILDESTRSLNRDELETFHAMLRRILDAGTSALLVSHNLEEVMSASDRVTVLRDGRVAGAGIATRDTTEEDVARIMLGRALSTISGRSASTRARPDAIAIAGLTDGQITPADFSCAAGEIIGITGVPEAGFERIAGLLGGVVRPVAGRLTMDGADQAVSGWSAADFIDRGVCLVPERRERDGLAFEMSVQENIALPALSREGSAWHVGRGWQRDRVRRYTAELGIRPPTPMARVRELSGGNQQKVLLAKWLSMDPAVIVLHEPTQAVDVEARIDILNAVLAAAERGVAVILVSIEPTDLIAICDRILVYSDSAPLREVETRDSDELLREVYSTADPDDVEDAS